jgi:hypothetical protein
MMFFSKFVSFSKRFDDLADRLSGVKSPPDWMVDRVFGLEDTSLALEKARDDHPLRHCDFMKPGTHGGCIAHCFKVRLKSPGVMVDCTGIESRNDRSFRGKLSGEVRMFERKSIDIDQVV